MSRQRTHERITRRDFLRAASAAGVAAGASALWPGMLRAQQNGDAGRPNIVFILADDMGAGDPQCYNPDSLVPTPNMDRLARQGMMARHAYCPTAVCTPTRYELLTGRYSWRTNLGGGVRANWEPPLIDADRPTLPGMLKQAGYRTAGFGKWHLGAEYSTTDGKRPAGYGKFDSPDTGANIDFTVPIEGGPTERGLDRWYGFACASEGVIFDQDRAVALLEDKQVPAHPSAQKLEKMQTQQFLPDITRRAVRYVDEAAAGAKDGAPFFLYYAPYVPHVPLAVEPEFRGRTRAGDYGDYVHELDHYIGVLLQALERNGLAENTLVMLASDNGSQFRNTGDGHVPNAPFRGIKWQVWEGGVRTPFIARWPGRIQAGSTTDQVMGLLDVMATTASLTRCELPEAAGEDSFDMSKVLLGKDDGEPVRESIVVRGRGARDRALRMGRWKYVPKSRRHPARLYDLLEAPREDRNLIEEFPDRAAALETRLGAIITSERTRP